MCVKIIKELFSFMLALSLIIPQMIIANLKPEYL
jgi:hypothetical protein